MRNYKLILPEHLNQFGYLFGGHLLMWVDEVAWIAASLDYPGHRFVTIAFNNVEFHKSVREGSILQLEATQAKLGTTSIRYRVSVERTPKCQYRDQSPIFTTEVTLVRIDEQGHKTPI